MNNDSNNEKNIPDKPGLYLARSTKEHRWYNLLVEIYGVTPYLKTRVWASTGLADHVEQDADAANYYYGPQLASDNFRDIKK